MRSVFLLLISFTVTLVTILTQPDAKATDAIPLNYKNANGTAAFTGPLANTPRTYQLLIHSSQLTSFVGKDIKGLTWRLPSNATANYPVSDITFASYRIYLSGSVDPVNRSLAFFANNVVGPQTQVRSGPLTVTAGSYPSGGSPNSFGPEISFDIPYSYTGGNLLVEIRQTGFTGTSRSVDGISTSTSGYGTLFSACWKSGDTATFSASQGNFSVVQLITTPTNLNLNLTAFIEGRYDLGSNSMVPDTAKVLLRSSSSPYIVVDSSSAELNSSGNGILNYNEALNGTGYYIVINHRNSIETWSAAPQSFTSGNLSYDFSTSAAQAFGNNMLQLDSSPLRFGIYVGDPNKDGVVDVSDAGQVDNDASNFVAGYVLTDLNGDFVVDVSDAVFPDNNSANFISKITP